MRSRTASINNTATAVEGLSAAQSTGSSGLLAALCVLVSGSAARPSPGAPAHTKSQDSALWIPARLISAAPCPRAPPSPARISLCTGKPHSDTFTLLAPQTGSESSPTRTDSSTTG